MATMRMQTTLVGLSLAALTAASSCGLPAEEDVTATTAALTTCSGDWTAVASPNSGGGDNSLASVSGTSSRDVWAVGQFAPDANPNITLTLALHFDGSAWSVVETPNLGTNHGNALLGVTAQPGRAWAAGYDIGADYLAHSLIEAWDGQAWRIVDHPHHFETENLYGIASTGRGDVWAVGSGRDGEGAFHTLALRFDGHGWSVVPTPDPGRNGNVLYSVVASAPDDVWAVGQQIGDEGPDQALTEHWDGRRWSVVPANPGSAASTQLIAVDQANRGDVRAVGDAQDGVVSLRTFAVSSENGRFSVQPTADPAVGDNRLTGVAVVDDDESWAVGSYLDDTSGNLQTLIVTGGERAPWTPAPSPNPSSDGNNQLSTVTSVRGGGLWAVGAFDGPDAAQTLILHRCR